MRAARLLRDGQGNADLRAATDALGRAAQDIGLDRFKPFLRQADAYLDEQGGLPALVRDTPGAGPPQTGTSIRPPLLPAPGRLPWASAFVGLAAQALPLAVELIKREDVRDTIRRFGLDPGKPADVNTAYAFLWAEEHGPWVFGTPQSGPVMEAMAERVMRLAQADPALFGRAVAGDRAAQEAVSAAVQAPAPGSGIETRNEDEHALVMQMTGEGKSGVEIQAALDALRKRPATSGVRPDGTTNSQPPSVQQIPPEQLRFSQRTAGANGRTAFHRQYVQEHGTIVAPVDAVRTPDGIVTIDNTRVAVARERGLATIPVRVWEPSDPLPANMAKRFRGLGTWGEALQRRLQGQLPEALPPNWNNRSSSLKEIGVSGINEFTWIETAFALEGFAIPSAFSKMIASKRPDQGGFFFLTVQWGAEDTEILNQLSSPYRVIAFARRVAYDAVICIVLSDSEFARGCVLELADDRPRNYAVDVSFPSLEAWTKWAEEDLAYWISKGVDEP